MAEYVQVEVRSAEALGAWLEAHHGQAESIWLVTFRKGEPDYLPYAAIVEEALAYGWIDSLPRALDARRTMVRLSPRKAGSAWSAANRARVAQLIAQNRMRPAGLAKVEAAKADGSWDRLKDAEAGVPPPDFAQVLRADAEAEAGFDALTPAARKRLLEALLGAKRAETRARRIAGYVEALRAGVDPTAWRPRQ